VQACLGDKKGLINIVKCKLGLETKDLQVNTGKMKVICLVIEEFLVIEYQHT